MKSSGASIARIIIMARAKLPCPYSSCDYETVELEHAVGMKMLEMHERASHKTKVSSEVRAEKVKRPQLVVKDGFVTEEAFGYFEHSWKE